MANKGGKVLSNRTLKTKNRAGPPSIRASATNFFARQTDGAAVQLPPQQMYHLMRLSEALLKVAEVRLVSLRSAPFKSAPRSLSPFRLAPDRMAPNQLSLIQNHSRQCKWDRWAYSQAPTENLEKKAARFGFQLTPT
jgi:hypothetical protein